MSRSLNKAIEQSPTLLIALLIAGWLPLRAQIQAQNLGEVETTWPGIRYQIFHIERMPQERLLIAVRIVATPQAPPSGTLIGVSVPIPADATKEDLLSGRYSPRPLSLASSEMIDEETKQKYRPLPPVTLAGRSLIPSVTLSSLRPGQAEVLSLQFAVPTVRPSSDSATSKQTVSFVFPNAKGPITKVAVPASSSDQ
jgi:hypothetical protein